MLRRSGPSLQDDGRVQRGSSSHTASEGNLARHFHRHHLLCQNEQLCVPGGTDNHEFMAEVSQLLTVKGRWEGVAS